MSDPMNLILATPDEALDTTRPDMDRLEELEATITRGVKTFIEVGNALAEVRDAKLYRLRGYTSFETFVFEKWGIGRSRAYQLIDAASTAEILSTSVDTTNEAMLRAILPMVKQYEDDAVYLWKKLVDEHGGNLSAAIVKTAVHEAMRMRKLTGSAETIDAVAIVRDTYSTDSIELLESLPDSLRELVERAVQKKGRGSFTKRGADLRTIKSAIKKHKGALLQSLPAEDRELLADHVNGLSYDELAHLVAVLPEISSEDDKARTLLSVIASKDPPLGPWEPIAAITKALTKIEQTDRQTLVEADGARHLHELDEIRERLTELRAAIGKSVPSTVALDAMAAA